MILAVHQLQEDRDGERPGCGRVAAGVPKGLTARERVDLAFSHVRTRIMERKLEVPDKHLIDHIDAQEIKVLLPGTNQESADHQDEDLFAPA